ncbi:MAG TPA: hypothetical protein VM425_03100 [Myxococcota bacterium]|nr:hypothetical protein [Myxococcota bacterium]
MEPESEEQGIPVPGQEPKTLDPQETRFRDLVENGNFKSALRITTAAEAGKKLARRLGIDPLALAVFLACFLSLVVIALLTLFH